MKRTFSFASLPTCDLVVDATYEGGTKRNTGDDVLAKLIPGAGNQGGFRQIGNRLSPRFVLLYSSMDDQDWPDSIDIYSGILTYFGDNKKPGLGLHETSRGGNLLLQQCFSKRLDVAQRAAVPPFFVFTRGLKGRDIVFRGLAAPGVSGRSEDDLIAVWRSTKGQRFQNYIARFTILDEGTIKREWIEALTAGNLASRFAPDAWRKWIDSGTYSALSAVPTLQYRTTSEQTPSPGRDASLVQSIYEYFKDAPHGFEHCAARLVCMLDDKFQIDEITRQSADGGRDAIGTYRFGPTSDRIALGFALEAKCYASTTGVGVKELSRLISRLRHREFGVLVTTSYLGRQAYEELRHDRHPVIILPGTDIAKILLTAGLNSSNAVRNWLESTFPLEDLRN